MGIFGKSENKDNHKERHGEVVENGRLELRAEELDIAKNRVQTGAVNLRKEIVEEQKVVDVPVTHEEVVIERRAISNQRSDAPIGEEETIHIPVSREQVTVDKHTVLTGEVSALKREVEETQQVRETVKREEARVETDGDPNIIADETHRHLH
ncbi:MAG: YsnF/AvaK domain-containing protein [Clostridia bacterium]|nr:YsnF/AvaK domain-containing protein [Clostridia bacterium]